jgi:tRNA dimethylallyltransferase
VAPVTPRVVAIFGPTASGKTAVAEALAEQIPAEIISADAMQVYEGLPVLTNQPERPTRLVAVWPLDHEASVGEYQVLAHAAIDEALPAGRTPVVVGGTGLYLRAALSDLGLPPPHDPGAREHFERLYDRLGAERSYALLAERDPAAAARLHANDRRRIVRALELCEAGESLAPAEDRLWADEVRHPTVLFGLDVPRELLAARIAKRTLAMVERGAAEEARRALAGPISSTARQVIGLRELATLPHQEAVAAVQQRTRRYAAYQRKWMRRIPGLIVLNGMRPPADLAAEIVDELAATAAAGR